jgi:hypothetical protein
MSFIDFIQKIQRKPRYVRIQILCLAVFVCMALMITFWVVSLKTDIKGEISESLEGAKKETTSLKEAFKASIGAFFEEDLGKESEEELEDWPDYQIEQTEPKAQRRDLKPMKLPSGN